MIESLILTEDLEHFLRVTDQNSIQTKYVSAQTKCRLERSLGQTNDLICKWDTKQIQTFKVGKYAIFAGMHLHDTSGWNNQVTITTDPELGVIELSTKRSTWSFPLKWFLSMEESFQKWTILGQIGSSRCSSLDSTTWWRVRESNLLFQRNLA